MGTTNQIAKMVTHIEEAKYNTEDGQQITRPKKKRK